MDWTTLSPLVVLGTVMIEVAWYVAEKPIIETLALVGVFVAAAAVWLPSKAENIEWQKRRAEGKEEERQHTLKAYGRLASALLVPFGVITAMLTT